MTCDALGRELEVSDLGDAPSSEREVSDLGDAPDAEGPVTAGRHQHVIGVGDLQKEILELL